MEREVGKRGQGISMTYLIIAILGLIVLIIIAIFFTKGTGWIFGEESAVASGSSMDVWRSQCESWCDLGSNLYCTKEFVKKDGDEEIKYSCLGSSKTEPLGVSCDNEDLECI